MASAGLDVADVRMQRRREAKFQRVTMAGMDLPQQLTLGYCTNVHPGHDLATTQMQLREHAAKVRELIHPEDWLPVGLWLSDATSRELDASANALQDFRDLLAELQLLPFTLNAFPYGQFHDRSVKHRVYQPDWTQPERLDYTLRVARLQREVWPDDNGPDELSLSTLPIGWGRKPHEAIDHQQAGVQFIEVAQTLDKVHRETGIMQHVCLEPEPGCDLDSAEDVVRFFQEAIFPAGKQAGCDEEIISQHLRVCHDVCHSAVMFEPQQQAMQTYRQAGIKVGKVQVSSALKIEWPGCESSEAGEIHAALTAFDEATYLHQTCFCAKGSRELPEFFDDLGLALARLKHCEPGELRVHFHVPIFADTLGVLSSTRDEIAELLSAITDADQIHHFEVETYAWHVLPDEYRSDSLAEGIAREINWCQNLLEGTHAN